MEKRVSGSECAVNYIESKELQGKGLSNEEYLDVLYAGIMGREADETGRKYWLNSLNNEEKTREQVFEGFSKSAVFKNDIEHNNQEIERLSKEIDELSVKTIKTLANLYKISPDIIFEDKLSDSNDSYFANKKNLEIAEPQPEYGVSDFNKVLQLLPNLVLAEQISVMAKLASLIQENSIKKNSVLPQKNKKIPDAEYAKLIKQENLKGNISYSHIREALKNDEW